VVVAQFPASTSSIIEAAVVARFSFLLSRWCWPSPATCLAGNHRASFPFLLRLETYLSGYRVLWVGVCSSGWASSIRRRPPCCCRVTDPLSLMLSLFLLDSTPSVATLACPSRLLSVHRPSPLPSYHWLNLNNLSALKPNVYKKIKQK